MSKPRLRERIFCSLWFPTVLGIISLYCAIHHIIGLSWIPVLDDSPITGWARAALVVAFLFTTAICVWLWRLNYTTKMVRIGDLYDGDDE